MNQIINEDVVIGPILDKFVNEISKMWRDHPEWHKQVQELGPEEYIHHPYYKAYLRIRASASQTVTIALFQDLIKEDSRKKTARKGKKTNGKPGSATSKARTTKR